MGLKSFAAVIKYSLSTIVVLVKFVIPAKAGIQ